MVEALIHPSRNITRWCVVYYAIRIEITGIKPYFGVEVLNIEDRSQVYRFAVKVDKYITNLSSSIRKASDDVVPSGITDKSIGFST